MDKVDLRVWAGGHGLPQRRYLDMPMIRHRAVGAKAIRPPKPRSTGRPAGLAPGPVGAQARYTGDMTDQSDDTRVIIPEADKYNATLVKREDDVDSLARFWVRPDGEITHFEPGQYMTIGVYADDKLYQRPYSVASAPSATGEEGYEFYVRLVPILRFTTLLWRLPVGHQMRMIGPKGRFMLEPDDDRTHLFVSTGTGIAPFIAMSQQLLHDGKPRRTVMVHGCSHVDELGYRELLEGWQREGTYPMTYVPTISRPDDARNKGWNGYTGRAEAVIRDVCQNEGLDPDDTVVYLCGNPEMIINVESELLSLDYPEFHVKKELYWPKGKKPSA
jgi:ferredoxin-NADP reductase